MKKKYKVTLRKGDVLGKLSHQFIEVKIADKFYTAIKNAVEEEIDDNHTYSLDDLILLRSDLIRKQSFLAKVDQYFGNDEEISKYEFYQHIVLDLKDLRDFRTGNYNAIAKILTGDEFVRGEVDNYILDIFNLIKYNKLLKKIRGLSPDLSISIENQGIISNLRSKYDNDFHSLEGAPKSVLLIEYLHIKNGKIDNFLFGEGNQKLRASKFENIYGVKGDAIIRTKNKENLNSEKQLDKLFKQNVILEKSILFVYSNLSDTKENLDLKLLIELLDIWKTNTNS